MLGLALLVACEAAPPETPRPCPEDTGPVADTGPTTPPAPTGAELRAELLCRLAPATELRAREGRVADQLDEVRALANYPKEQVKRLPAIDEELSRMDEAAAALESGLGRAGRRFDVAGERLDVSGATVAVRELRDAIHTLRDELAQQLADGLVDVPALDDGEEEVSQVNGSVQKKTDDTASAVIQKVG